MKTSTAIVPLDNNRLQQLAPSIFAPAAHSSRSSRYAHISTLAVVDRLREVGFLPMTVSQAGIRKSDDDRANYAKHMIRFRHADFVGETLSVGQVFPEVVLVNSHDGTSSYKLSAGLFRLVCGNGLVISSGEFGEVRIRHGGDVVNQVLSASFEVLEDSRKALTRSVEWSQRTLLPTEQQALAIGAHHLRFADAQGVVDTPIQPEQLLRRRRTADEGGDLWSVFNRVQENTIKGGLSNWDRNPEGKVRRVTTREVKGIDGNLNLNKALWKLAEHLAGHAPAVVS